MVPDGSSTVELAQSLAEPHLFMAMLLAMVLIFAYVMYRAYVDRQTLHAEIRRLEGRLQQCEEMWRDYHKSKGTGG